MMMTQKKPTMNPITFGDGFIVYEDVCRPY